ncbi:MAG TPA: hypothetical protein PKY63_10805 [Bacteroidales bacterium]|nr:hypothetical protein [Bacteroidales bacterium]
MKISKKTIWIISVIAAIVIISGISKLCSSSNNNGEIEISNFKVKPISTEIEGGLKGYLSIVDGTYEGTSPDFGQCFIKIKIKVLKTWSEVDKSKADDIDDYSADLKLTVLDENGIPISGFEEYTYSSSSDNDSELHNALKKGTGDLILNFASLMYDSEELAELFTKAAKFQVSGDMNQYRFKAAPGEESTDNQSESSGANSSTVSKSDCESFINGYEKFASNYLAFSKKYKKDPNDPTLISDAAEMNAETLKWSSKLESYGGCDDPSYIQRLAAVQATLAKAAANLY